MSAGILTGPANPQTGQPLRLLPVNFRNLAHPFPQVFLEQNHKKIGRSLWQEEGGRINILNKAVRNLKVGPPRKHLFPAHKQENHTESLALIFRKEKEENI